MDFESKIDVIIGVSDYFSLNDISSSESNVTY